MSGLDSLAPGRLRCSVDDACGNGRRGAKEEKGVSKEERRKRERERELENAVVVRAAAAGISIERERKTDSPFPRRLNGHECPFLFAGTLGDVEVLASLKRSRAKRLPAIECLRSNDGAKQSRWRRRRRRRRRREKKKTRFRFFFIQRTGSRRAGRDTRPGRGHDARARQVRRGGKGRLHSGSSRARAGRSERISLFFFSFFRWSRRERVSFFPFFFSFREVSHSESLPRADLQATPAQPPRPRTLLPRAQSPAAQHASSLHPFSQERKGGFFFCRPEVRKERKKEKEKLCQREVF